MGEALVTFALSPTRLGFKIHILFNVKIKKKKKKHSLFPTLRQHGNQGKTTILTHNGALK
jgi:hypothetical protein